MTSDRIPEARVPNLTAESAFVVHMASAATDTPEIFEGRIEHVISGRSTRFASMAELIGFMRQILRHGADARVRR